ncbi:MAG: methylenetetrahydrofolate reductase, partial [Candidatus Delongbacteria bacterium]|nr:methylenetetrahydrofolate reductase [Candidatus Delongbacteria bacterium]
MAKVTDIIKDGRKTFFSIEITPPDRGRSINDIFSTTDQLIPYDPQFINVTYHQPYIDYTEDNGAVKRIHRSKKPGTVGVCAAIQNKYKVDAVPHLICGGHDKYETEDALIDLYYLGIENVFVVRGDTTPGYKKFIPERYGNVYAADLVDQISCLNKGKYIDELDDPINTNFCIGVAGYPEKHCEALNFDRDMLYLKEKVDKGADYIITQMSFDLIALKKFADKAKNLGINVP